MLTSLLGHVIGPSYFSYVIKLSMEKILYSSFANDIFAIMIYYLIYFVKKLKSNY